MVTLEAADLFKSGSAEVNKSYEATLDKITAALNKVPGRVNVVGHTDDQAIKSLIYRDNEDLSRERAVSVANILRRGIDNQARVTWRGVGSSQPLVPGTDPESRARNRRVEIIHLREQ
jgi:type VI secretion system protein ImpK